MPWAMSHRPAIVLSLLVLGGGGVGLSKVDFSAAASEPPPAPAPPLALTTPQAPAHVRAPIPPPPGPRTRLLAHVRAGLALSERPGGPRTIAVGARTEFGSPRVLGVAARRGQWLGLVTSERPNNRLAWIRRGARGLELRRTRWTLRADLSTRTLTLRRGRRVVHRARVAVGRPGSDTPTGRFAVTDKLRGSGFGPYYGCCVLALNGHQPSPPQGWTGGNRLAIHGTNTPGTIEAAASAGCLRAGDSDLEVLMAKVPLGTPVFIRP
jgi:L,D-transpeptidase catalytic domain